jgi:hypothetical protein
VHNRIESGLGRLPGVHKRIESGIGRLPGVHKQKERGDTQTPRGAQTEIERGYADSQGCTKGKKEKGRFPMFTNKMKEGRKEMQNDRKQNRRYRKEEGREKEEGGQRGRGRR